MSTSVLLSSLKDQISQLASNANIKLADLGNYPSLEAAYATTKLAVDMMYDTKSYPEIVDMIKDVVSGNDTFNRDTIGSYLKGCMVGHRRSDVPSACAPSCVGAIPSNNGMGSCLERVFVNRDGYIQEQIGDRKVKSEHAYLFSSVDVSTEIIEDIKRKENLKTLTLVMEDSTVSTNDNRIRYGPVATGNRNGNGGTGNRNGIYNNDVGDGIIDAVARTANENGVRFSNARANIRETVNDIREGVEDAVNDVLDEAIAATTVQKSSNNWWIWLIVIIVVGIILWLIFRKKPEVADVNVSTSWVSSPEVGRWW
ncbi:hypothetical protein D3C87_856150 [compost metagenome]